MTAALGSRTIEEIQTQPTCWRRTAQVAGAAKGALPRPGERVLVLGCGTSYFIAQAYADLREQAGQGETDARVAGELGAHHRRYDRVLIISRSGTSAEVVEAGEQLHGEAPITALVGVTDSPVAKLADHVVDLEFADESSVVQTRFATTALTTLRVSLGEELDPLVAQGEQALRSALPAPPAKQLVVLGTGWAASVAQEAALKCRESAGVWVEAYPAGEYRHGPISVADAGTLVWAISPLTDAQREAVLETGAALEQGGLDPMAELVRIQRLAVGWAADRGRDADVPTNLSRSVTEV
ncbi:SIS domain-containing protein [Nocardioides sp.]|uniref:SIS domain-containing protein n=1 Tax=Nocardioides sp. TaxID=35761 RepID=UPI00260409B1|nr:SIS domain-containing protein [Nocardioides sp.]MDI6910242.1 SIS domain-containing protein [Nocardioides sp.]